MTTTPTPFIIGFSGKIGSGKDYIAKEVVGNYLRTQGIQYMHLAFGDALKVTLLTANIPDAIDNNGVTFETLYVKKTEKTRVLLQTEATNARKLDENIWIKHLDTWVSVHGMRGVRVVLISDVRFPNEIEYIKQKGGIIFRILAPERTIKKMQEEMNHNEVGEHMSETALNSSELNDYDGVIYNDKMTNPEILAFILPYIKGIMAQKLKIA
jgi:hypothetical protein